MAERSVTRTWALGASSSSWRIWDMSTHSWASPVADSLMPSGLSRTTSRANSTERPARWTVPANACAAVVLRMPWDPMKAILAQRVHVTRGGYPARAGHAAAGLGGQGKAPAERGTHVVQRGQQ